MLNDFRFGLGIFTTYLTYICLKCLSSWKITLAELALHNANKLNVIFYVKKRVKAYACQMCGKYAKTKSGIVEHFLKEHNEH